MVVEKPLASVGLLITLYDKQGNAQAGKNVNISAMKCLVLVHKKQFEAAETTFWSTLTVLLLATS